MLRGAAKHEKYATIVDIVRQLAVTGCRRSEMIGLKWTEADTESSSLRLEDSKEGDSIRPIGGCPSSNISSGGAPARRDIRLPRTGRRQRVR